MAKQTTKVHQLTTELGRQVDLVAQYDAFLTLTEEKNEVLTANLHKQNQTVLELKAELARQKDSKQATAVPTTCLEKLQPSATTGIPDVPKFPSEPVSTADREKPQPSATTGIPDVPKFPSEPVPKAEENNATFPLPLDVVVVGAAGLLLAFLALLMGCCCGARKRKAKILLDQKLALPGPSMNQPILRRVRSVGKNGREALVDLTTVDLSASI